MNKDNIYSSSAFISLLKTKYSLDLLELACITNLSHTELWEIQKGYRQLGEDAYIEIQMELGDNIEVCDFNGLYNKNKELRDG